MAEEQASLTLGVRWQLASLVALVCVVGVGTTTWLHLEAQSRLIRQGLEEQSVRTAEVLARSVTSMILREQVSSLRELSEEALRSQGAEGVVAPVVYVTVTDDRGRPLYDSEQSTDGQRVLDPELAARLTGNAISDERLVLEVVPDVLRRPVLDVSVPCSLIGVDGRERLYGLVRLGVRMDALEDRWWEAVKAAGAAALGAILLGLLVGYVATGNMLRFVASMTGAVERIASGDLSGRIHLARGDELGQLADAIDRMAEDLQKRELLKRYISATVWDEIEERGVGGDEQDSTLREVTVLFLDIRNYTSLSEVLQSQEIVSMLNEVFTILIEVVDEFGGVLDKFIGDALLVVFYPGEEGDDAVRAVYAACRMQEALQAFNERRKFYGRDAVSIGVGINTGTVIAGSVGSQDRKDYTVIGDPVNVAARLQERSKLGKHTRVVLSGSTFEQVSSLVEVDEMEGAEVRGKIEAIQAFEVVALKGLKAIFDDLEAEDPQVRTEAFQALEATGGEEAVPHLIQVLGAAGETSVLKAIPILARLGRDSEVVTRLVAALVEHEQDPRVLATAIRALGNLPGFGEVASLKGYLIHEDARVRANTIEALEACSPAEYLDAVAPLLHDPNQRVKANAAVVLWRHGRRDVVRVLSKLAESGAVADRASAVFALGELFASEALPSGEANDRVLMETVAEDLEYMQAMVDTLEGRLQDEAPQVVERAVVALVKARDTRALPALARLAATGESAETLVASMARIGTPPRVARLLREWWALRRKAAEAAEG